jgi:GAF domain-containing protein
MALPLKVEGEVIGVLDVQSEISEAFTQEDTAVLQIMADQLAVSIRRVQLVQELEDSLGETKRTSQQFTTASWRNFSDTPDFKPGYAYDGTKLSPISDFPASSQEVLRRGHSIILSEGSGSDGKDTLLGVPLKLRDQAIGVLNIRLSGGAVTQDTISLLEDAANRLAIALENARLYTETQKLAERERAVSEIAARITTSTNIDSILRTTVLELGRILPNSEVTVQIQENKQ